MLEVMSCCTTNSAMIARTPPRHQMLQTYRIEESKNSKTFIIFLEFFDFVV